MIILYHLYITWYNIYNFKYIYLGFKLELKIYFIIQLFEN